MGVLKKSSVYLAGPIDFCENHGVGWRCNISKKLLEMDIVVFDPTSKPGGILSESHAEQNEILNMKINKKYNELKKYMKKIRRYDLRLVDNADFVIAYIDTSVHMCGSYDEIFTAEDQKKPIFYIVNNGIDKLSSWMYAVIDDFDLVFDSVDDCVDYIKKIDHGLIPLNDKWVLFKNLIKSDRN